MKEVRSVLTPGTVRAVMDSSFDVNEVDDEGESAIETAAGGVSAASAATAAAAAAVHDDDDDDDADDDDVVLPGEEPLTPVEKGSDVSDIVVLPGEKQDDEEEVDAGSTLYKEELESRSPVLKTWKTKMCVLDRESMSSEKMGRAIQMFARAAVERIEV